MMLSDGAQSSLTKSSRSVLSSAKPTVVQSASAKLMPLVLVSRSSPEMAERFDVLRFPPMPTARTWVPAALSRSASATALLMSFEEVYEPLPPRELPWPFTPEPELWYVGFPSVRTTVSGVTAGWRRAISRASSQLVPPEEL